MEFILQGVLQQHEERVAGMLEAHKQQVVDALIQQLVVLNLGGSPIGSRSDHSMVKEPTQRRRPQPLFQSQQSDSAARSSTPASQPVVGGLRTPTPTRPRLLHHETVSEVSENLRRGKADVLNWLESRRSQGDCCLDVAGCRVFTRYVGIAYKSRWFEWFISLAILLNAVLIGLGAEMTMQDINEPIPRWYRVGNGCFLAVFVAEIVIRWVTEGCFFLDPRNNKNFWWNVFDLLLVLSTLAEEVLHALHAPALNLSFVRLARVLRLMRVTRVLRVLKQLKELRIMVHGMLNCGKPLFWASLLLGLLAYMYVVFCLQLSSEWLRTLPDRYAVGDPSYPQASVDFIYSNFGSLRYGIYTLLKCITGGVSWEEIADPLYDINPLLLGAFLLYVLFGMACLLNLITAVFLEAAYQRSHSEEAQLLEHIEQKRVWIRDAKLFFHNEFELHFGGSSTQMTKSVDGHEVNLQEFIQVVQAPRVRAWFEEHGLDIYFEDPKSLFELIDMDSDHKLDVHEFVVGLYRLKGGASSLNLQLEIQQILGELKTLKKTVGGSHSYTRRVHFADTRSSSLGYGRNSEHLDGSEAVMATESLGTLPETGEESDSALNK